MLQERRADLKIPEVDSFPPKTKLFLSLSFFAWEVGSLIFPIRETEILKHPAQYLAFNKEPHQCHCLDHLPFKDASCIWVASPPPPLGAGSWGWKWRGSSRRAFCCRLADFPGVDPGVQLLRCAGQTWNLLLGSCLRRHG